LGLASFYDLKTREIRELLWLPAFIVTAVINFILIKPDTTAVILSIIPSLIVLALVVMKMMGGADFIAMLLVGLSMPYLKIFPISLLTLLYSSLIPATLAIYNIILNLSRYRDVYRKVRCDEGSKSFLLALGKPMRIRDFIRSKYLYPLTLIDCVNNTQKITCRSSFNIDEDYAEHIAHVRRCVESGYLDGDGFVWVTPALPHIVFITVGFILALLTPTEVILHILSILTHI